MPLALVGARRSNSLVQPLQRIEAAALERANAVYASIAFAPSRAPGDQTFGILEQGEPVALGRLQRHADGALEVGGFWVRQDRRGRGLARRLVACVLASAPAGESVWCIPFEHLRAFYESFGMRRAEPSEAPASLRAKLDSCRELQRRGVYTATLLLHLPAPDAPRPAPREPVR